VAVTREDVLKWIRAYAEVIKENKEYSTWCFSGFKKYFSPVVDKFLIDFEKIDKEVEPLEGYDESVNVKDLAIKTEMGFQGRNTLVINEKFNGRLRFRLIKTNIDIEPTGEGINQKQKNAYCDKCRLCELACPTNVLKDYKLNDIDKCLAHKQLTNRTPNLVRCNLCWRACPKDMYWAKQKQKEKELLKRLMWPS
jgi:epoxyqueuosine reductase QueG